MRTIATSTRRSSSPITAAKHMPLVINGRFLTRPKTGVDRVAENVVSGLDKIWPEHEMGRFIVAVPPGEHAPLPLQNGDIIACGRRRSVAWEQRDLPRHHPSAVIFNPCNTAPIFHSRNIVVIHDANVFDYPASYAFAFRAWYKFLLPRIARRALRVVTVSNHSAQRLAANRIVRQAPCVISNGCDHFAKSDPWPVARRRMVLFAGSPAPHKNLDLFARLAGRFESRGVEFAVAGSSLSAVFSRSGKTVGLPPQNLQFMGRVSEAALVAAYREASLLLFPSFVEGFGLTPIEAQSFGCPVVSSDRPPMLELLGESALYADPLDVGAWEAATDLVLSDPVLAERLSGAGRLNAARFTWAKACEAYLEVILSVLAESKELNGPH